MTESRETKQKKEIDYAVNNTKTFFTAQDIYNKVKKNNIGIATVYRFLNELKKNRKIHFYVCNRKALYSLKNMNHSHFICESCGKIDHLNISRIDFLKNFVSGEICHFQIEVSGICESCKRRNVYK